MEISTALTSQQQPCTMVWYVTKLTRSSVMSQHVKFALECDLGPGWGHDLRSASANFGLDVVVLSIYPYSGLILSLKAYIQAYNAPGIKKVQKVSKQTYPHYTSV